MSISFRAVNEQDIPRICSFARDRTEQFFFFPAATWPLTPAQLQGSIDKRSDSTVIERDGVVVGFANFYRWENGGTCTLGNVIVDPQARGQGIGAQLIEHMIAIARTRHQAGEVTLSCFNTNVAGLLLYPKLGFTPFSIEERQDRQGQRLALIHLRLAASG
ncbi:GNAT family N-acetyltransferase [Pseudomonas sp. Irchel s3a18]|uniref:GNAT family N-acetyltransferase n=1 Tax=Pseudomonas sp. Irchel s3a18 TaxID=2009053 RepID=UPI000BA3E6E1|nr:GNAT family N-acetyltransferase [Pseudomonas sp. Irchel s3a18]